MSTHSPGTAIALDEIERLIRARRKDLALIQLRGVVEKRPPIGGQWARATDLAMGLGDDEAVLAATDAWIAAQPTALEPREARIDALERLGRSGDALEEAVAMRQLPGGEAPGLFHQGVCLAFMARTDESMEALRQALKRDSKQTRAWDYITAQKTFEPGDRDLVQLQKASRRLGKSDPNLLAPVIHALGRAYDDIGHTAGAFQKFTEVGRLARKHAPYDVSAPVRYCDRLKETFSREFLDRAGIPGSRDATPVFIVGPPRSGTTLLERMLSTHPSIQAGGEHTLLRVASYPLGNFEPPELERALAENPAAFEQCGTVYASRVRARFGDHERVTDKTPNHHFFVGVLRLALPNARLIWARRDLRDTAWSCFKTRITGNRWSEDIGDTVTYLKAYHRLMTHWKALLGDELLVVDYEDLVERPEPVMDRVFDHVGVHPDQGWRRFHETTASVATASMRQVRQPLNTRAVGAWRKYEKFLAVPFKAFDEAS